MCGDFKVESLDSVYLSHDYSHVSSGYPLNGGMGGTEKRAGPVSRRRSEIGDGFDNASVSIFGRITNNDLTNVQGKVLVLYNNVLETSFITTNSIYL